MSIEPLEERKEIRKDIDGYLYYCPWSIVCEEEKDISHGREQLTMLTRAFSNLSLSSPSGAHYHHTFLLPSMYSFYSGCCFESQCGFRWWQIFCGSPSLYSCYRVSIILHNSLISYPPTWDGGGHFPRVRTSPNSPIIVRAASNRDCPRKKPIHSPTISRAFFCGQEWERESENERERE